MVPVEEGREGGRKGGKEGGRRVSFLNSGFCAFVANSWMMIALDRSVVVPVEGGREGGKEEVMSSQPLLLWGG